MELEIVKVEDAIKGGSENSVKLRDVMDFMNASQTFFEDTLLELKESVMIIDEM